MDQVWMPRPKQLFDRFDPITADFAYVRWLGDRKGIEEKTKTWNKIIVNRTAHYDDEDKQRYYKSKSVVPPRSAHAA